MPEAPAAAVLAWGVVPAWLAAGVADWACHRATAIAHTSGVRESRLHLLMLAQTGLPVLAVLALEVTAPVLALCLVAVAVHEATAWWDLRVAHGRRAVYPREQLVHSFLELLPLLGAVLLALAHPQAWHALTGAVLAGQATGPWHIGLKSPPLPAPYVAGVLGAAGGVAGLYLAEFQRCRRAAQTSP